MMNTIPKILYSGVILDCYIGKVVEVKKNEYKWQSYCKLKFVKSLYGTEHRLHLDEYTFTKTYYSCSQKLYDELIVPSIGTLIQVLIVGEGYGDICYIKLMENVDEAEPIPLMYYEVINSLVDNYQI